MKIPMGISYVFLAIGIVLLAVAAYFGRETLQFLEQSAKTEGTVVKIDYSPPDYASGDTTPTYRPVVRFAAKDGQTYVFTGQMGMASPRYRMGEKVSVAYNPGNPRKARINDLSLWLIELVLGVIGSGFALFGGGILLARSLFSRREQYLRDHGLPVKTEFLQARHHPWLVIGNHRPFVVETRWRNPATAETHTFRSSILMFDPTPQIKTRPITVFIDRDNPRKYHVDLSFLAGTDPMA